MLISIYNNRGDSFEYYASFIIQYEYRSVQLKF